MRYSLSLVAFLLLSVPGVMFGAGSSGASTAKVHQKNNTVVVSHHQSSEVAAAHASTPISRNSKGQFSTETRSSQMAQNCILNGQSCDPILGHAAAVVSAVRMEAEG